MAARKATTRKKAAPKKKTARKKAASTGKKRAKRATKKSAKKQAGKKKRSVSLGAKTRKVIDDNLRSLERELPKHLKSILRDIRNGIGELEDQVEKARGDAEKRWKDLENQVRRDSEKMLKRFGLGKEKKKAAKKSSSKAKRATTRKKRAR